MVRRIVLAAVAGAAVLLLAAPARGETDEVCTENPCPGYRYVVVYRESDGWIRGAVGWPAVGDALGGAIPMDVRPGEAVLEITGDERLIGDLWRHFDDYFVDARARRLAKRPLAALAKRPLAAAEPAPIPLGVVLGAEIAGPAAALAAGFGAVRLGRQQRGAPSAG
jgi:hypothetical protein